MNRLVFVCMFGPSSLIAIVMWWREPRLWWACLGILATATGVVLYLPVRVAFYTPSSEFDGLGIFAEFMVFSGLAAVVHLGLLLAIQFAVDGGDHRAKKSRGQNGE
jgi:hypothetical protein